MDIVRLLVCGNVDDGKSSLIGRLLFDSKSVLDDQIESLERTRGNQEINLANLTDGLKAEREQGITIDVAYRFFSTPKRKFIIADTPGHVEYTRNMVTGASTADLAILLVDARKGLREQTRRHSFIANKLGIKNIIVAINKMDQIDYSEDVFNEISTEFKKFIKDFNFSTVEFVPISALFGDNIVIKSKNIPWYKGTTILDYLENIKINYQSQVSARLPIQFVVRASEQDFRGYAGQITSGEFFIGQSIVVLPSGQTTKIKEILIGDKKVNSAKAPLSITLQLVDEFDVGSGFTIIANDTLPAISKELVADICWLNQSELVLRKKYLLKSLTTTTQIIVTELISKVNINALENITSDKIALNDLGKIRIKSANSIIFDDYKKDRKLGSFILIDEHTNQTICAGMLNIDQEILYNI